MVTKSCRRANVGTFGRFVPTLQVLGEERHLRVGQPGRD